MIKKTEREYSLARNQGLVSSTARLIQFPLVLAWAVTVHKFQGQTVKSPQKVVIDLRSILEAAQAYVMASRVQQLDQLYILEELPKDKIYANHTALMEIERLLTVSKNSNPTKWMGKVEDFTSRICFLNCRSLRNKFHNILNDGSLLHGDVIILLETWLEGYDDDSNYILPGYNASLNKRGRGKGTATFCKGEQFKHETTVSCDGYSLVKITSKDFDIIGVYRSQNGNILDMIRELKIMRNDEKKTIIGGDFNVCVLKQPNNYVNKSLTENGFQQIVTEATHIDGGAIDQIYLSQGWNKYEWSLELCPKYYSDHDGLYLSIWKSCDEE